MKIFKRVLIGIAAVIVLLLLTALFVKNEYKVQEAVTINQPKEKVFHFVKQARNHDRFNKWTMSDPDIRKSYKGTDGTVGFVYAWESDGSAGKGEQETSRIREGEQIDFLLRFKEPFESNAAVLMKTESLTAGETKLTWSMEGRNPYPFNLMNLFLHSLLGKDMQTSLATLKGVLEKE
jgi:hypothetical protein